MSAKKIFFYKFTYFKIQNVIISLDGGGESAYHISNKFYKTFNLLYLDFVMFERVKLAEPTN